MRSLGQLCLLTALICSGYTAFVYLARPQRFLQRVATTCGIAAVVSLTGAVLILAWGLVTKDFRFDYVAHYSSPLLPWQYSLSALWVGQGGSLLLWAWMLAGCRDPLSLVAGAGSGPSPCGIRRSHGRPVVSDRDPGLRRRSVRRQSGGSAGGRGLSPLLQHPTMLIHPPVVFFAYAAWTVPFALAMAALICGRLDAAWTQMARPWALLAWSVLGSGVAARSALGLPGTRLGRLLGLGPGGKRLAASLADRHGADSLPDGLAPSPLSQEDRGHRSPSHLRPVQLCHLSHAQRHLQQRACLQRIADRLDVLGLDGGAAGRRRRADHLAARHCARAASPRACWLGKHLFSSPPVSFWRLPWSSWPVPSWPQCPPGCLAARSWSAHRSMTRS